jgi:mannobiose 2-epimerase
MRNPRATLVAAPTVLVVALTAPAAAPAATVSPPVIQAVAQDAQRDLLDPEIRGALAAQVKASLRHDVLAAWYPRVEDREAGGFLGGFDHAWRPTGDQRKMIVAQARHVWTAARAAELFPDDPLFLRTAAHGFRFLRDVMWDSVHGGFHWLMSRDGNVLPEPDDRELKRAYGVAFAIYGLAAYHDVSGDPAALQLARDAFIWLDRHAHDPEHGGYFNYVERDGTPLRTGYGADGAKDQNSSIHLLEAFTELYRVWPDPLLRDRLREMLVIIRDTLVTAPGTLTLFTTADWTPVLWRDSTEAARRADDYYHDHVSFGHDIETAYLLLEATEALSEGPDETTLRVAKQLTDHALRNGWDDGVGGLMDAAFPYPEPRGLTIVHPTKTWWVQAEALNTLLNMGDRYPDDPLRYHERFLRQWGYIQGFVLDPEHGGWFQGGLDRDPGRRLDLKAHIWKASYHSARALMNVAGRLEGAAAHP